MWERSRQESDDPEGLFVNDNAKRSVSLRVSTSDYGRVKAIARRLRTRESHVFRFAIRLALDKLAPLYDPAAKGARLMPVFAECGTSVAGHFQLDARRLAHILNADAEQADRKVDREDVELLAMAGVPERYLAMRLKELLGEEIPPGQAEAVLCRHLGEKYLAPTHESQQGRGR